MKGAVVAKVIKRRTKTRSFQVTIRWTGPQPGSARAIVQGKDIGDAMDNMDDLDNDSLDLPEDIDKVAVTGLHIDIKDVPS
jgi:hypothetical protein